MKMDFLDKLNKYKEARKNLFSEKEAITVALMFPELYQTLMPELYKTAPLRAYDSLSVKHEMYVDCNRKRPIDYKEFKKQFSHIKGYKSFIKLCEEIEIKIKV